MNNQKKQSVGREVSKAVLRISAPIMKDLMQRQLDRELGKLSNIGTLRTPAQGWIRSIRQALGMTTAQLARRLGVVQQRVTAIEQAEQTGGIRLETLQKVAQALNCELAYFLVPKEPLEKHVKSKANEVAKRKMEFLEHSMALEAQSVGSEERRSQIEKLAKELIEKHSKEIWDEE